MENKRVFVVVSAAIPKSQKLNTLATKVSAACLRASRADSIAKYISETQTDNIVYGLDCSIYTSVIDTELNGTITEGEQIVYVVVAAAIPISKGMHPIQSKVNSVWTDRSQAELQFQKLINQKNVTIKNTTCDIHATIIEIKLDKL